jgi:hypothetical protein
MSYVMVAVGGMNALQQVQAGRYAKGQANLQADALDYQGKVEEQQALQTARLIRRAGAQQVAQTVSGYAGAGAVVGEGSAGEAERYVEQNVEHDAFQALLEGSRRARGMQTQATVSRIDGQMRQTAGEVQAVGTLLSTGATAMKASGWRTKGPGYSGQQAPAPVINRDFKV